MQPVFFLILLALFSPGGTRVVASAGDVAATTVSEYPAELVARANALHLHEDIAWLNLVHYKRSFLGYRSLVDDPKFFNAKSGKTDPRAELAATIHAFFQPLSTNELVHPMCRFVARYSWLDAKLDIDESRLPVPRCETFEEIYRHVNASSVALVFPSAYMNGPASMFGHTLLVFDAADRNRLLSRAVSYAAKIGTQFGPIFAFGGITGLYPGYYAIQPYYEKVEQYGDLGHRDVWEYKLDFTPAEVDMMIRHAWEVQNTWSRYYFFDENCAYNLNFFFDVARPSLHLSDNKGWFVIPIDTVKAVDQAGLITSAEYRPCTVTRIKFVAARVGPDGRKRALDIARGRKSPAEALSGVTNKDSQIDILDLASEFAQYLYTEGKLSKAEYSPRFIETLRLRSKLGMRPGDYYDIPPPPRPDRGHGPLKLSIGAGVQNDDAFASLRGRIAYHSLLDNHTGYEKGAEIQFLHTDARYYPERDAAELQELDVIRVLSLAPRSEFFHPGSWKVLAGLSQLDQREHADDLVGHLRTGAGLVYEPAPLDLAWVWLEGTALGGGVLDQGYAAGGGPAAGFMYMVGKRWKHLVEARANYFALGQEYWETVVSWDQDVQLSPNSSLSLELSHERNDGLDVNEAQLRLNLYF